MRSWKNALWLAGWEARKNWITHSYTAAIMLLFGIVVALLFGAMLGGTGESPGESFASGFSVAFFFVAIVVLVPHNSAWVPRKQTWQGWQGFFSDGHIAFLRSLPISVREVVLGRALTFIVSVLVFSCLFFAPSYLLSGPLRGQLGVEQYLLFVGFWVGLALVIAGLSLFTELGLGGKAGFAVHMPVIFLFGLLAAFLGGIFEVNYILEAVEMVRGYGPLPTVLVLLIGAAALVVSAAVTTRLLRKRDLSP